MLPELVEWQIIDDTNGLCYPWFTHPFLEVLKTWNLKDKSVLEYGGGRSTLWWASKTKQVHTIEANGMWAKEIVEALAVNGLQNTTVIHRPVNEGDQSKVDYYTEIPDGCKPDIVVVDGILRHECLLKALTLKRPLIVIHDNWQQDGFVCPASEEAVKDLVTNNFIQENHTDNHGRKWATAYWNLL
jgi:hypothetical protein